jgi:hypothetical protein
MQGDGGEEGSRGRRGREKMQARDQAVEAALRKHKKWQSQKWIKNRKRQYELNQGELGKNPASHRECALCNGFRDSKLARPKHFA